MQINADDMQNGSQTVKRMMLLLAVFCEQQEV